MARFIRLPTDRPLNMQQWVASELKALRHAPQLAERLKAIDKNASFQRAYVMGNGRSGTWLLAALLTTLEGVDLYPHEVPFELFGLLKTKQPLLALKRDALAYRRIENIPLSIHILYIVRHPYDVLTSHNPARPSKYHVLPYEYLANMLALQYLLDTSRPHTTILKYEDLVRDPTAAQSVLAAKFGLSAAVPANQIDRSFNATEGTAKAMHGVRPIDANSVGKYLKDPEKLAYLESIRPRLGRVLDWVAETFGYDVSLPGTKDKA